MATNLEMYADQMQRRRLISRMADIGDSIDRCKAAGDRDKLVLWQLELDHTKRQLANLSTDPFSSLPRSQILR